MTGTPKHKNRLGEGIDPRTRRWTFAALGAALLPHVGRLPIWIVLFSVAVGVLQWVRADRKQPAISQLFMTIAVIIATLAVMMQYGTVIGQRAGLGLLVLMLTIKLFELRTRRDVLVALYMSYFLVGVNFVFVESIPIALYMFGATLVITAGLLHAVHPAASRPLWRLARLSGVLVLQAIPLMVVVFVFFPRLTGGLWTLPEDASKAVTGLDYSMNPGAISSIAQSKQPAFRVAFEDEIPPPEERYWRGPVFWYTDGQVWTGGKAWHQRMLYLRPSPHTYYIESTGKEYRYTVTLEPHRKRWLFALDLPLKLSIDSFAARGAQWISPEPVVQRLRYDGVSLTGHAIRSPTVRERRRALQLPDYLSPRVTSLAHEWHDTAETAEDVVEKGLAYFRAGGFRYTLNPPLMKRDFAEQFLFEYKEGFCEHFAGAFALLMRAAGIPTRIVTGYMGGELNPLGDYIIVRQSHAHAWCEVWLSERGWVRVDPTVQASPQRLVASDEARAGAEDESARFTLPELPLFRHLRYAFDAVNYGWNHWIIDYGPEAQQGLMSRVGFRNPSWAHMLYMLFGIAVILVAAMALWMRARVARSTEPVISAYQRFCDRMAAVGVVRHPHEGPLDFARRISAGRPDLAERVGAITQLYVMLRYGRPTPTPVPAELQRAVRVFRPGRG